MNRCFQLLIGLTLQICLFLPGGTPAHAVIKSEGYHTYYSSDESEFSRLNYIVDPKEPFSSDFHPFREISKILFLGDGFEKKSVSLAELVQPLISENTTIYRTDITCPYDEDLGKIVNRYVDHQGSLPFSDNEFGTIVLRQGLCHCYCLKTSCAGIENNPKSMSHFLSEVSRVLDKKNPHSIAYLHGAYFSFCKHQMASYLSNWEDAIRTVEPTFPNLKYTLIHKYIYPCKYCINRRFSEGKNTDDFKSKFLGIAVTVL